MSETVRLLTALITADVADRKALLAEDVLFRQADGSVHQGHAHVLQLLGNREAGASYRVIEAVSASGVLVELKLPEVPGAVIFELHGETRGGRLFVVHVEV